jgi:hypothetical protein
MTTIVCKKCGAPVTKSGLYKEPKLRGKYRQPKPSAYRKDIFWYRRKKKNDKNYFLEVNPIAVLDQTQLVFRQGNGCCGNSGISFYCACGTDIGKQRLDCHESKIVAFDYDKVEQRHKM